MSVLAFLGRNGPASRADLARALGLSPATLSQVTRRLISQGVVEPLYFAPSKGGRPGQMIGLMNDAGRAVGVELAADHLVLVETRLDGQVLNASTEGFDASAPEALEQLASSTKMFLRRGRTKLLGVGVCVPGVVARPDAGEVDAKVLGWKAMPLGARLRRAVNVPVLIENDVKALALAERLFGLGRDHPDFALLTIGRGVGFACVAGGALQRGAGGGAGELAHVVVSTSGQVCACGERGCLEAYVGAAGLVAAGKSAGLLRDGQGVRDLTALAGRGEARAREIFAQAAQRLAHAVAPALAALNPAVLLVAGEGTAAWQHWDTSFRSGLAKRLPAQMRDTPVHISEWDDTSWARGAAALVLATAFDASAPAGKQRLQVLARLHGRS